MNGKLLRSSGLIVFLGGMNTNNLCEREKAFVKDLVAGVLIRENNHVGSQPNMCYYLSNDKLKDSTS